MGNYWRIEVELYENLYTKLDVQFRATLVSKITGDIIFPTRSWVRFRNKHIESDMTC